MKQYTKKVLWKLKKVDTLITEEELLRRAKKAKRDYSAHGLLKHHLKAL